jgi:AmmeMemoRadiSam system protein A
MEKEFSDEERVFIKELAKKAVENYLKKGTKIKLKKIPSFLEQKRACFVTLNKNGNLRGCIGNILPKDKLYRSIINNAINAGFSDPRFPPLRKEELDKLSYEVSILTIPEKLNYANEGELLEKIKQKGVIIRKGFKEATYLPQVWQHFKKPENFLSSLCQKAFLGKSCWKEDIEVFVYDAIVIK